MTLSTQEYVKGVSIFGRRRIIIDSSEVVVPPASATTLVRVLATCD